jgi:hypothetical protein
MNRMLREMIAMQKLKQWEGIRNVNERKKKYISRCTVSLTPKSRQGISTTSMIQRVLEPSLPNPNEEHLKNLLDAFVGSILPTPPIIDLGNKHCQSRLPIMEDIKYVYVGCSWDCFGSAHVEYLRRVKEATLSMGNCKVVVGIWSDEVPAHSSAQTIPLNVL